MVFWLRNSWLFPVLVSVHVTGLALLVGTIAVVDLRMLGFGLRTVPVLKTASELRRWTLRGLWLMIATGLILFSANVQRYLHNPAFLLKMLLFASAVAAHFTLHRRPGKAPALLSLALWACVVIAGRGIADFDV